MQINCWLSIHIAAAARCIHSERAPIVPTIFFKITLIEAKMHLFVCFMHFEHHIRGKCVCVRAECFYSANGIAWFEHSYWFNNNILSNLLKFGVDCVKRELFRMDEISMYTSGATYMLSTIRSRTFRNRKIQLFFSVSFFIFHFSFFANGNFNLLAIIVTPERCSEQHPFFSILFCFSLMCAAQQCDMSHGNVSVTFINCRLISFHFIFFCFLLSITWPIRQITAIVMN